LAFGSHLALNHCTSLLSPERLVFPTQPEVRANGVSPRDRTHFAICIFVSEHCSARGNLPVHDLAERYSSGNYRPRRRFARRTWIDVSRRYQRIHQSPFLQERGEYRNAHRKFVELTETPLVHTMMNETASGWQQVNFASPVAITANTNYVFPTTNSGQYSRDGNYRDYGRGQYALHAREWKRRPNGPFGYGSTSAPKAPTNPQPLVDVVFTTWLRASCSQPTGKPLWRQTATFSVTAIAAPLSYQWRKNGGNITGATSLLTRRQRPQRYPRNSASVSNPPAAPTATPRLDGEFGLFRRRLRRSHGQTVVDKRRRLPAPGTAPLSYQWMKNGGNITGATSARTRRPQRPLRPTPRNSASSSNSAEALPATPRL
jgi:hypothetical protein